MTTKRWSLLLLPALAAAALFGFSSSRSAQAEDGDKTEFNARCARRVSISLLGKSPDAALLASAAPQGQVDALLGTADFQERYARFTNSVFNSGPGEEAKQDAVYSLAKHILAGGRPWKELFNGPYRVDLQTDGTMKVVDDPEGLGYFRSREWLVRYAGNESTGVKLNTAFRILNNTTNLELIPSVAKPGEDRTAAGREAPGCKTCHFENWYGLDLVAKVLTKRVGQDDAMKFEAPTAGPQQLLGKTIANDKELVTALVESDSWKFAQCRNVFRFLYGRAENVSEGHIFDTCVDELTAKGTIQAAIASVAKDASFCQ